jgi:electron transfer flavoprotein-quinone oxidoreductase
MDPVDVCIVGAGLAGLSAAWHLADSGLQVLVVERGDAPGAKNVTGGRLYLEPLRAAGLSALLEGAPFERRVVRERIGAMTEGACSELAFEGGRFRAGPPHSVTVLRAKLDRWLGDSAGAKGVFVVPGYVVDGVILENGRVAGVRAGAEEIRARVTIAADGVLSAVAVAAGLRPEWKPEHLAVGAKEVIGIERGKLADRFGLEGDEGEARLWFGSFTRGLFGGAFLYTNLDSVSVGIVLGLRDLSSKEAPPTPEILDAFKNRPEIRPLLQGGEMLEYSAHVVPEGGWKAAAKPFADGILAAGDAAGFALNAGLTVRGMEFALVSGALAAKAVKQAAAQGDFGAANLAVYDELLRASPLWKDLETFADAPEALSHPPLMRDWPAWGAELLERLFAVGPGPKDRAYDEAWRFAWAHLLRFGALRDWRKVRKI